LLKNETQKNFLHYYNSSPAGVQGRGKGRNAAAQHNMPAPSRSASAWGMKARPEGAECKTAARAAHTSVQKAAQRRHMLFIPLGANQVERLFLLVRFNGGVGLGQ
jgi:hypothetical protein